MADLTPHEFARAVQRACDQSDAVASYNVQILDETVIKIRVILTSGTFINVFYNAATRKCSYALIENDKRVYGVDNAFIGWHIHPFSDPTQHIESSEVSFEEFLKTVEELSR